MEATQNTRRMNERALTRCKDCVVIVTLLPFSNVVEEAGNKALADLQWKQKRMQ